MEVCRKCGAQNIDEARYCEVCGVDLAEVETQEALSGDSPAGGELGTAAQPSPGSLRDQIPFLTGAVEQAKARIDSWKQRSERSRQDKVRQEEAARQEQEQRATSARGSLSGLWSFLLGLVALAAFIYLLLRLPRGSFSPAVAWMLLEEIQQSLREQFGLEEEKAS
ncbi:MAG: zinc ribbon domain-containing protein [Armatimonadetes bacterium]|nr:zinc ribbon domain-containing protein [Armatimonadota bacterium]